MSSSSGAKSGSSICDACCIAREVRPILRPLTTRPSASSSLHPGALDRVAVVDRHLGMALARSGAPARALLARRAARRRARRSSLRRACGQLTCRRADAGCCAWRRTPARPSSICNVMPIGRLAKIAAKCACDRRDSASPVACCTASLRPAADAHVEVARSALVAARRRRPRSAAPDRPARACRRSERRALAVVVALREHGVGERRGTARRMSRLGSRLAVYWMTTCGMAAPLGRSSIVADRAADGEDRDRRVVAELAAAARGGGDGDEGADLEAALPGFAIGLRRRCRRAAPRGRCAPSGRGTRGPRPR